MNRKLQYSVSLSMDIYIFLLSIFILFLRGKYSTLDISVMPTLYPFNLHKQHGSTDTSLFKYTYNDNVLSIYVTYRAKQSTCNKSTNAWAADINFLNTLVLQQWSKPQTVKIVSFTCDASLENVFEECET